MHTPPRPEAPRSALSRIAEMVALTGAALLLSMAFRATVASAYEVPTGSMEPTIMSHDRIIAEKVSVHFAEPRAGEVVLIANPVGGDIPYVKRVIATAGQTVDLRDGRVYVDGAALAEPYTHDLPSEPDVVDLPTTVPAGHLWVMGDNRTDSKDSRYFGPVPADSVIGRPLAVYWPPQHAHGLRDE